MSVGVHQEVLIVLREELLDELVARFVDRLNDDAPLFWLDVEASALGGRHSDREIRVVLHGEGILDKPLRDILDASYH